MDQAYTNRLIDETSPYLLQHAHNPVDWYPWGKQALTRARKEDTPILVSIGYSACHWCHVMEHESFEDIATARVMNELFVCIKVDREERPDLDKIYQLGHQMLTQRPGGWPLNMFLMPADHTPFFGGTYFPKGPRHGMPPFVQVLRQVAGFYRERHSELEQQNQSVRSAYARMEPSLSPVEKTLDAALLDRAQQELSRQFEPRTGGFGGAPKFPHATHLERCLRYRAAAGDTKTGAQALHMAVHTLRHMTWGGIYDQVGGGFCRYSVDDQWMIPHFEKMLYDNGPLQAVYADASILTGETLFADTACGIGEWVLREMQAPEGGYYSSLDADSEGEEGKYYVWTPEAIRALLNDQEWRLVKTRYELKGRANFEGRWHLHARVAVDATAQAVGVDGATARERLAGAHQKLYAARENRVRPGLDDKILTSWNGLMIHGMARAGRLLGREDFVDSAQRAADFIRRTLWVDERLMATTRAGRTHLKAYLDDYAYLVHALMELLQARWRSADLHFAIAIAEALLEHFEDREHGAFFFTADDHEKLLHRHKPASDEATPAGNGIAVTGLLRLGHLVGEPRYLAAAERALTALSPSMQAFPQAHGALLNGLEETLSPTQTVILRGRTAELTRWQRRCSAYYAPRRVTVAIPADAADLPEALALREPRGEICAYLCSGMSCSAVITDFSELDARLRETETPPDPIAAGELSGFGPTK